LADTIGPENIGAGNGIAGGENSAPGNPGSGPIFFDPSSVGGPGGGTGAGTGTDVPADGKRKRGRPRGSGTGQRERAPEASASVNEAKAPLSIDGVSAILLSVHTMAASFFAVPELDIEKSEANNLANAIKSVADHYDVKASEKSLAWANLVSVTAMVYGTRMFAYRARKSMERADTKTEKPPANVVRMQ